MMLETELPHGFDPDDITPPLIAERLWPVTSLALDISGRCNLACRYCAEKATLPPRAPMSSEILDGAWKLLCLEAGPRKGASIRLGSGEPLLAFPLLRKLASLLARIPYESGRRPTVFLTTNGTLIDEDTRDWLVESGWHVKISMDGPEFIHDRQRIWPGGAGSAREVSSAVAALVERMPQRLSVTAVLCRGSEPEEVFESIARLRVGRIELVPVAHHDHGFQPGAADILSYKAFLRDYVDRFMREADRPAVTSLVRLSNCVVRVMGYSTSRVPCGAGRSFFAVDPEGDLYPCFRFVGLKEYRLGSLFGGLCSQAVLNFQRGAGRPYEQRPYCRVCWAAPLCGGPCFACAEMFGPGEGSPLLLHCAYALANARAAVQLVLRLREKAPERLLSFLSKTVDIEWPSSLSF